MYFNIKRTIVQVRTLLLTRRHYPHPQLSLRHRLYLIHIVLTNTTQATPLPLPNACNVLPSRGIVVERSFTIMAKASLLIAHYYSTQDLTICHLKDLFLLSSPQGHFELQGFPAIQCLRWMRFYRTSTYSFRNRLTKIFNKFVLSSQKAIYQ